MLKIAICEDDPVYLELLSGYVLDILSENRIPGELVCKTGNPSTIRKFLETHDANVFLLDIDLGCDTDGYALAQWIGKSVKRKYIVFVTEHLEFLLQAFKAHAFDFLPKPATKSILNRCLTDVYHDYLICGSEPASSGEMAVKSGASTHYINMSDLVYVEKTGNKSVLHTIQGDISCYRSLESFEAELRNVSRFVRCHKSFLVNRRFIQEIRWAKSQIVFTTGQVCDIGRKYRKAVMNDGL